MDRTLVIELRPTDEQKRFLQRTLQEYTACFNAVRREGFEKGYSNGIELHKATYYPLRALYPDLPAQLVCAARVKATETIKSALTWKKKHEERFPKRVAQALKAGKEPPVFKPIKCPHVQISPI